MIKKQPKKWLLQHCYDIEIIDKPLNSLKYFSFNDNLIEYEGDYNIKTNDKQLPFKLYSCASSFMIEAPYLKNCINFPESMYDVKVASYIFAKCHALNFSTFKPVKEKLSITISDINNISIAKIFKNTGLRIEFLSSAGNSSINDVSLWDDINTENFYLTTNVPLKNLIHILSIPKSKMYNFKIMFYNDFSDVKSFYDIDILHTVNSIIAKYRDTKDNPEDFMMDMTLELIDNGFEHMV